MTEEIVDRYVPPRMRDVGLLPYLKYRWQFFLWMYIQHPNTIKLVYDGVDKKSRDIIYARHWAKEPKKPPVRHK